MQHEYEVARIIEAESNGFEVHWDYLGFIEAVEMRTQSERLDGYVDGFTDGILTALEIPRENICRKNSSKTVVKGLDKQVAVWLAKIIDELYWPLVTAGFRQLQKSSPIKLVRKAS